MEQDNSHFGQRCRERGIVKTNTFWLWKRLLKSIETGDGFAELVKTTDRSRFYRFECRDGTFFAVTKTDNNLPLTIYTPEMLKDVKRRIKLHKKGRKRMTTVKRLNRIF